MIGVEGEESRESGVRKVKHEDCRKSILNKERGREDRRYGRQNGREDVPMDKPGRGVLKRGWGEVGRHWEVKDESSCGRVLNKKEW